MVERDPAATPNVAVLLTDRNYLPPALFVAHQLARQNPRNFDVRILATDCPEDLPERLDPGIVIQKFVPDGRADMAVSLKKKPPIAFGRLTMDAVLPDHYRRILYLDCDVWIGERDISKLFDLNLGGFAFAAVRDSADVFYATSSRRKEYKRQLGMQPDTPYFNSGMMLIDRQRFYDEGIGERSLDYIAGGGFLGALNDQNALNAITKGDWLPLSPIWNWTYAPRDRLTAEANPAIIHFISRYKPWNDTRGRYPPRYRQAMAAFFARWGYAGFVKEVPWPMAVRHKIKQATYDAKAALGIDPFDRKIRAALAATPDA